MRPAFSPFVERHRDGGESTWGSFLLPGPKGDRLRVVVGDGVEWEEAGLPLPAWEHVSVSLKTRTPTWAEMEWVRELFFADDELVLQFSVPRAQHINIHEHVLHLWRPIGVEIPLPPPVCV